MKTIIEKTKIKVAMLAVSSYLGIFGLPILAFASGNLAGDPGDGSWGVSNAARACSSGTSGFRSVWSGPSMEGCDLVSYFETYQCNGSGGGTLVGAVRVKIGNSSDCYNPWSN